MTTEAEALDIIAPVMERIDKLTIAVEKLVAVLKPSDLAQFHAEAPRTASVGSTYASGPLDPDPPFPAQTLAPSAPVPEFRPMVAVPWVCPIHKSSRMQPSGAAHGQTVTAKSGATYTAFLVCGDFNCKNKEPRR